VNDYISDMHLRRLPPSRPLWEFHFLNYKTSTASATLIINLHHTLGDGTSLMSLLLACSTRADNRSRPTSECTQLLPESQKSQIHWFTFHNVCQRLFTVVLIMWCTLLDLISSLLRLKWIDDSELPIRGPPGVEWMPKVMSSATFTMEDTCKCVTGIYFLVASFILEPEFSTCRYVYTKMPIFMVILDDLYDAHETLDNLNLFSEGVKAPMVVAGFATQTESRDEFFQESHKVRTHGSGRKFSRRETF
jgi:hypothetical protein